MSDKAVESGNSFDFSNLKDIVCDRTETVLVARDKQHYKELEEMYPGVKVVLESKIPTGNTPPINKLMDRRE